MSPRIVKPGSQRGWWGFPILCILAAFLGWDSPTQEFWTIVSMDIEAGLSRQMAAEWSRLEPAMIWLKDGAVHMLYLKHVDGRNIDLRTFRFLAQIGYTLKRGLQVMSKRWSRFARNIGLWAVVRDLRVGPMFTHPGYEGYIELRRSTVMPMVYRELDARKVPHLKRLMRQWAKSDSQEFTAQGRVQIKGEAHWGDPRDLDGNKIDVGYLAGEEKKELVFFWGDDDWLLTIIPRSHKPRSERFDIQLIANEMGWIGPRRLVAYLHEAMAELMEHIRAGDTLGALSDLGGFDVEDLIRYDEKRNEGKSPAYPPIRMAMGAPEDVNVLMWFPAFCRQMAAEALRKWDLYHIPIRNGDGFKLRPAEGIPEGAVRFQRRLRKDGTPTNDYSSVVLVSPDTARAICDACDRGDLDDVYILMQVGCRGRRYLKAVRRPAMIGQYKRLRIDGWVPPDWDCPQVKSLKEVFPTFKTEYPELVKLSPTKYIDGHHEVEWPDELTVDRAVWELHRAEDLVALVGSYANTIMVMAGALKRLLPNLPITMSDLIDVAQMGKYMIAVKPIREWMADFWKQAVLQKMPLSPFFWECVPERYRTDITWDKRPTNPFNELMQGVAATIKWYEGEIDRLALQAKPPTFPLNDAVWGRQLITLFRNEWRLIHLEYGEDPERWNLDDEINAMIADDIQEARQLRVHKAVMGFLSQLPLETQYSAILAAYRLVLEEDGIRLEDGRQHYRDSMFTMGGPAHVSGTGREFGLSDLLVDALIHFGYIGDLEAVANNPEGMNPKGWHVEQSDLLTRPEPTHRTVLVRGWGAMMEEIGQRELCGPIVAHEKGILGDRPAQEENRMFPGSRVTFGMIPWRGVERLAMYSMPNLGTEAEPVITLRRFGLVPPEHMSGIQPLKVYCLKWITFDGHSLAVQIE